MEKWIAPNFKKFWLKGLQKQKLLQTFLQVQICTFRNELKGKGVTFKQKVFLPALFFAMFRCKFKYARNHTIVFFNWILIEKYRKIVISSRGYY